VSYSSGLVCCGQNEITVNKRNVNAFEYRPLTRFSGGYRWYPPKGWKGPLPIADSDFVLSTGLSEGLSDEDQYIPPSNLFLAFADTPLHPEGIKSFADRFGMLRSGEKCLRIGEELRPIVAGRRKESVTRAWLTGETCSHWCASILRMKRALMLWSDLLEADRGEPSKLEAHIRWDGDTFVCYDTHPNEPIPKWARQMARPPSPEQDTERVLIVIASETRFREANRLFRPGEKLGPARYCLQRMVNERLRAFAVPELVWRGGNSRDLSLHIVPDQLLGTMWVQFAEAVHGGHQFRRCVACDKWIVVSRDSVGSRSSRLTCSNACRMRVYNGRKADARRLRRGGASVVKIAKRLKTTPSKVVGWLGRTSGQ
jgi:hypothetical protein